MSCFLTTNADFLPPQKLAFKCTLKSIVMVFMCFPSEEGRKPQFCNKVLHSVAEINELGRGFGEEPV